MPAAVFNAAICIVDDDQSLCRALGRLLRSAGLRATLFENGSAFLVHAAHHPVALAILDVMMPDMSGLELQERLHQIAPGAQTIIITGCSDTEIRAAALAGGARGYLKKPFDDDEFLALIHGALRAAREAMPEGETP
jgi:FixJ family two-component response regulator